MITEAEVEVDGASWMGGVGGAKGGGVGKTLLQQVLGYKVKGVSRESPSSKASNVLDADLRTHWSSSSSSKEWLLLELLEPCLLSHIRVYNKSVIEWEISVGLSYKPESFVKLRSRCEAPRRDIVYPMNHTACRYVRISCLRGNPISIYFIQLIGVSVPSLHPAIQPVVNYLLPQIISQKQDASNMHLQLLQDISCRLLPFLPYLEADLATFADKAESTIRFFAMLIGPFYPILRLVDVRDDTKVSYSSTDSDSLKNNQSSIPTVSSNFEVQPRRLRILSATPPVVNSSVFRSDLVIFLLKMAFEDNNLRIVCRKASTLLQALEEHSVPKNDLVSDSALNPNSEEISTDEVYSQTSRCDYSSLFGEDFCFLKIQVNADFFNLLDISAVEEGILHVLYAVASENLLCSMLAKNNADMDCTLPLVQALLPALRPVSINNEQVNDPFGQWKHPSVQQALSQIARVSTSLAYRPLLQACSGYLSSCHLSQAKTACVLIDLCSGPLSPWLPTVVAKVDMTIELLDDLLGVIQDAQHNISHSRAAVKYVILAIAGHMDDILTDFKKVKHKLLFLIEMLDPFILPATTVPMESFAEGLSNPSHENQERSCILALNVIRTAVKRAAVLPSLEYEWRRGVAAPSVLLSILDPHMRLPPNIDLCKSSTSEFDHTSDAVDRRPAMDGTSKADAFDDRNFLFAPAELKRVEFSTVLDPVIGRSVAAADSCQGISDEKYNEEVISSGVFQLDNAVLADFYNAQADQMQLLHFEDCAMRALEFQNLSADLSSQKDGGPERHSARIDALLLAAECYVNPFFSMPFRRHGELLNYMSNLCSKMTDPDTIGHTKDVFLKRKDFANIYHLETKRDKAVLDILLQAAKLHHEYQKETSGDDSSPGDTNENKQYLDISDLCTQFVDSVTLARKNQALLCSFIVEQFRRKEHLSHEILLLSLLFILQSATELFCPPDCVIDIILNSAENLNRQLTFVYQKLKSGSMHPDMETVHSLRRHWILLHKLVMASSGAYKAEELVNVKRDGFQFRSLVSSTSWVQKITKFSAFECPVPRFLGWMAVSRYAKEYLDERTLLAADFSQLTSLLSIFADELASVDGDLNKAVRPAHGKPTITKESLHVKKEPPYSDPSGGYLMHVLHAETNFFFPSMIKQFHHFGENILEAVGQQLKCLRSSSIPDILCWFSDMCLWPYFVDSKVQMQKTCIADNAKAVVMYLLESVIVTHMEALIPEMPRVSHLLVCLCRAPYADIAFLESVLSLLRPLISFFLRNAAHEENLLNDASYCQNTNLEAFQEIFELIKCNTLDADEPNIHMPLLILTLGSFLPELPFKRKNQVMAFLRQWTNFISFGPPSLYSYLCAFQKVVDNCLEELVQHFQAFSVSIPSERKLSTELPSDIPLFGGVQRPDSIDTPYGNQPRSMGVDNGLARGTSFQVSDTLTAFKIMEYLESLRTFLSQLFQSIEASWGLHYQLATKLCNSTTKCLLFLRCLYLICKSGTQSGNDTVQNILGTISNEQLSKCWDGAFLELVEIIESSQSDHCWQVALATLDYILSVVEFPYNISVGRILGAVCTPIRNTSLHAPKISWRLQSGKLLSLFVTNGVALFRNNEAPLVDLLCAMLTHPEPELKSTALQQIGKIVNLSIDTGAIYNWNNNAVLDGSVSSEKFPESIISILASKTWDIVATLAVYDSSLLLRKQALILLKDFVPFVDRKFLQSFLSSCDIILQGCTNISGTLAYLTRGSLILLANAFLYAPNDDIALVPEIVWKNLENMRTSLAGGLADTEKRLCHVLCQFKTEPATQMAIEEAISSVSNEIVIPPDLKSTRESILQVFSSLSSVESYFNFFSSRLDQQSQELEEAEIELELLQKEKLIQGVTAKPEHVSPEAHELSYYMDEDATDNRLQQVKDRIRILERSKLREDIILRRQKKLLMWHEHQKYMEEATTREMQLLQEFDRERTVELERQVERRRQLELERRRTSELHFNLEMEKEKQTQRELQLELEQVESGTRSSRREVLSSQNRHRERLRERENGRGQQDGSSRSSSKDHHDGGGTAPMLTSGPGGSVAPTVILAAGRSFQDNVPTILEQSERRDERGAGSYEDSADGGDARSIGDAEPGTSFDGSSPGLASGSRNIRGGKQRQIMERREREGRREGKWERKHS